MDLFYEDFDEDMNDNEHEANLLESREPSTIRLSSAWPTYTNHSDNHDANGGGGCDTDCDNDNASNYY